MSPCPVCRRMARHVAVRFPWRRGPPDAPSGVLVEHECVPEEGGCGHRWAEVATHPAELAARVQAEWGAA